MDSKYNKVLIIATILGSLGGVAAVFTWWENRKNKATKDEILELDRQIKSLTLRNLRN